VLEITPPPIPKDLKFEIKSGKVRARTYIIFTISSDKMLDHWCYVIVDDFDEHFFLYWEFI
jgi:hypothetical protein